MTASLRPQFTVRAATKHDVSVCARVYNQGWIDAFWDSGLLPSTFIESVNAGRDAELRAMLPDQANSAADNGVLIMAAFLVQPDGSEGEAVGVIGLGPSRELKDFPDHALELHSLYIDKRMYGCGVPQAMLREGIRVLGWTRESGQMLVCVFEANTRAMAFYRKIGAKDVWIGLTSKYAGVERMLAVLGWESVEDVKF
ncbi:acyl-CoA N-acyltransferase [Chytriomyces sp. MP71]|nr:acyl-CoA N-acyltransferase [Chytriomyces sp. MP71]